MSLQEEARRRAEALRVKHRLPAYHDDDSDSDDDDKDALFAAANALGTPSSVGTASTFMRDAWHLASAQASHHNSSPYIQDSVLKVSATRSTSPTSSPGTPSSVGLNHSDLQFAASTTTTRRRLSTPHYRSRSSSSNNNHNNNNHHYINNQSSPSMADQARRDWQNHGTGITQALEDVRSYNNHNNLPHVRVFASAAKVDPAGQDYTAYLIRVEYPNHHHPKQQQQQFSTNEDDATIIEHRFSDFYKLSQQLEGVPIPVVFPSRLTWAGRLGNWTPAQLWAPEQHQSLIQYRLKQLDAWLVHVIQMMPQLDPSLQECVYQFLDARQHTNLPCQQPLRLNYHTSSLLSQPKSPFSVSAATESLHWINPVTFTMGSALRQACRSVETLCHLSNNLVGGGGNEDMRSVSSRSTRHTQHSDLPLAAIPDADHTIPLDLLRMARGILFVTVIKAGWVVSGRFGTGLLVQRLDSAASSTWEDSLSAEWSAPTAIGTMGIGWGLLAGADVTHYMVIFTSDSAVRDLVQQSTTLQVGAELSAAMGPLGRSANSHLQPGDWTLHTAYAYAHSQGFFVGVSLEGSVWQVRHDVNAKFYGQRKLDPIHLLHQPGPPAAQPLYDRLDMALSQQP